MDSEKTMSDDLISRQAAIDMFQNMAYDDWNQGVSTSWADAFSECAEMIRDLPSAHPISENDLIELQDRYGDEVRFVVEDMLSGEEKRWTTLSADRRR